MRIFKLLRLMCCGKCAHIQCVAFCIPIAHIQVVAVNVLRLMCAVNVCANKFCDVILQRTLSLHLTSLKVVAVNVLRLMCAYSSCCG